MGEKENNTEMDKKELPESEADDTPPEDYTPEDWADLSPAEREGIRDGIDNPEVSEITEGPEEVIDEDALKKIAEEEAETTEKEPTPEENIKPETEQKPEVEVEKQEMEISDNDLLAYRPVVTDDEIKIEEEIPPALKEVRAEAKKKFDEGDLTSDEYEDERDRINRQIFKHNSARESAAKAEIAWQKEQRFFLDAKPEYLRTEGDDEDTKENKSLLYGMLNQKVIQLSNDPKNAHMTGMQILVKADKAIAKIKESLGLKKAQEPEKVIPISKEKKPPAPLPGIKTLSNVPAAGKNDALLDSFAQLDKLKGEAYEDALERLDPKVRTAYENSASRR
jgi:hypothetical protein